MIFKDIHTISLLACAILAVALVSFTPIASAERGSRMLRKAPATKVVSTLAEALEARKQPTNRKPKYCQGGRFASCVCSQDVTRFAQYRPALKECGGKAAVILSGKYLGIFSVVVRDSENRDRWPASGFGGCSSYERDILALNRCSAFKVQKRFVVEHEDGDAEVHCLGASGYSTLFKRVVRMTAKLSDVPNSTNDPLARWCLEGPAVPLN